jgi:hypothetical protein
MPARTETYDGPLEHQRRLLREVVAGRRFVVALDTLVGAAGLAASLREHAAGDVLVVGGVRGTGELPADLGAELIDLDVDGRGVMGGIRAFTQALEEPSRELVDTIERFDPRGDALVATAVYFSSERLLGRRTFAGRPRAWALLEDKTTVDAMWDAAGVTRAPSRVVPVERNGLWRAHLDLDQGAGTVWVADNRTGWHGGGHGLRWVQTVDDAEQAGRELAAMASRVRVMPFLDGRPCSIHGWVVGEAVATFRPCETVMLRETGRRRLHYAGSATSWLPSSRDRESMRDTAQRVGAHLRDAHGFRGVFTVDGVLSTAGFLPTELNPRFGAALATLGRGASLPLYLLHGATVERPELDWEPRRLEAEVLATSLEHPVAGAHLVLDGRVASPRSMHVRWEHGRLVETPDAASADGSVELGSSPGGSLLRVGIRRPSLGPAAAPLIAEAFGGAARLLGLDLPPFEAAPELRT